MKEQAWRHYEDGDVLARVRVRLIEPGEKAQWDALIVQRHYLGNANLVGRQLRYVAELDGQWVALLGWNVAAYHLKGREEWIGWKVEQQLKRRKFVAQNSRYLLMVDRGRYPNLASRVLSLCTRRLSRDWEAAFGYPLLVVESFVDPERFSGACYRAAGWEAVGPTRGYRRHHRDFYQQDGRPKELWVRALHPKARRWLGAETLPPRLARHEDPALHCPYTVKQFRSLWERMNRLPDVRRSKGRRHRLGSTLTICALATLCGARGTRAIADFASYLNQTQLRLLRAYRNPKTGRYEPPSEPTIRRMLKRVPAAEFDAAVMAWMEDHDPVRLRRLAVDGKTVKGSRGAGGRPVHLVAAVSPDSLRLAAQRPVDEKSNEITALRPMLEDVPLDGVVITADAMHAQQDAARFLHQEKGADYFFTLKGNQPSIQEKAQRLLDGAFPPSASGAGRDDREASRAPGNPPDLRVERHARTDGLLRRGASGPPPSTLSVPEKRQAKR
ncbi:MAG: ISAs1 family transposase [Planctomycetota bacterium]|jgi:hypothetical protein